MRIYFQKRLLSIIPIVLIITFLAFAIINILPSDPAEVAIRVNGAVATPEAVEAVREELNLNEPFLVRYVDWLQNSVMLDFGNSYISKQPVFDEIAKALPATLELAGITLLLIITLSVPIGIFCAIYKDSIFDKFIRTFIFLLTAMPNYWIGLLLVWYFAVKLNILPTSGKGDWTHIILPSVTLALTYISTYIRLIRNNMLENMKENYVLYAKVRGLKERTIVIKYVLKNSLQSCITALGMTIGQLIAGSFLIESIFAWPGIGMLCISAIFNRDYPIIQAYILLMAFIFIVCNLIVDFIQYYIDPRLRKGLEQQ